MASKVFIVQRVAHFDYGSLIRYGELKFVTFKHCYPDTAEQHVSEVWNLCHDRLDEFNPDEDYIALSGDPLNIALVAAFVASRWPRAKFLKFDRNHDGYYEVPINFDM